MNERTVPPTLGQAVEEYYAASPLPQANAAEHLVDRYSQCFAFYIP